MASQESGERVLPTFFRRMNKRTVCSARRESAMRSETRQKLLPQQELFAISGIHEVDKNQ